MVRRSLMLPRALRGARQKRHWTQLELAEKLGVTQSTISFWERGIETPTLEHKVKLVTLLPEVFEQLAENELDILARLYRLERVVRSGKCLCMGCDCEV